MYKLYFSPGSAAMAPQAVLEEVGAPYELIELNVATKEHERAEYKKLNPNGRIPTLIDGDFVIYETAAICQYLSDKHPEAKLSPPAGTPERGRYYQWLMFLTNTVQVGFIDWFHPEWTFDDLERQAALKARAEEKLGASFQVLNDGIGGGTFAAGSQFTVCDIYLTMFVRWSRFLAKPAWQYPNIKRVAGATYRRPAFQRMMDRQGILWPENWPKG
ncbi:MAG TPA: glutathione S-transferase family protein [Polyangiaceae bacterium]|nr:glutathione S-transferase family protein [Polyangiaceae bacterium]